MPTTCWAPIPSPGTWISSTPRPTTMAASTSLRGIPEPRLLPVLQPSGRQRVGAAGPHLVTGRCRTRNNPDGQLFLIFEADQTRGSGGSDRRARAANRALPLRRAWKLVGPAVLIRRFRGPEDRGDHRDPQPLAALAASLPPPRAASTPTPSPNPGRRSCARPSTPRRWPTWRPPPVPAARTGWRHADHRDGCDRPARHSSEGQMLPRCWTADFIFRSSPSNAGIAMSPRSSRPSGSGQRHSPRARPVPACS